MMYCGHYNDNLSKINCSNTPKCVVSKVNSLVVEQQVHMGSSRSTLLNSKRTSRRPSVVGSIVSVESGTMAHRSKPKVAPSYVGVLYSTCMSKEEIVKSVYAGMRIALVTTMHLGARPWCQQVLVILINNVEKCRDFITVTFK